VGKNGKGFAQFQKTNQGSSALKD